MFFILLIIKLKKEKIMAFSSNGQISYLVLDSLSEGSKYGLEIIEFISKKTNGGFLMKKPTLYSCLTRMEKKGLVSSSFWGESELGGKRHYYSITPAGRENLAELAKQVDASDFAAADTTPVAEENSVTTVAAPQNEENTEEKPTFLQQDNLFDMVKEEPAAKQANDDEESDVLENQIDMFSMEPVPQSIDQTPVQEQENINEEPAKNDEELLDQDKMEYYQNILQQGTTQEAESEEEHDDAVLLDPAERTELTPYEEEQNKRLYDTSTELKKYRKKKSFSENQIEMAVVYENEEDEAIQKARIAELKKSLLNIKNDYQEPAEEEDEVVAPVAPVYTQTFTQYQPQQIEKQAEEEEEPIEDDGHILTEPLMNQTDIPVQRKIAPTNIEINVFDDNLPAPKRNSDLEPSYKDMMSKLFERKTEKQQNQTYERKPINEYVKAQNAETQTFVDYNSLKRYYQARNIDFKEYKKVSVKRNYNTNFLQLIGSIVLLVLSGIFSACLFWIVSATNNLRASTNFMFYTVPILFLLYTLFALTKYKCFASKKAAIRYNELVNWLIFLSGSVIVFIVNVACGMQFETLASYSTSMFLPMIALLLVFPINFYTMKLLYRKYSK